MQSYFLAVNMVEGEGKNRFLPIDVGKQFILNKGVLCDKCARLFFFCGNIALCKWHTSNPIECNKMKQSVPSSVGLIHTMLMNL